jgi:quercetin dioxygenase-like cupin family protein
MIKPSDLNDEKHVLDMGWGKISWLYGKVYIKAGEANDRHIHPNCEEIIFVVSGECDHSLGDEIFHLKPGMALRIPEGVPHHAIVTSWEPCKMIIAYSSVDRQTIGE